MPAELAIHSLINEAIDISDMEFTKLAALVYDKTGIFLSACKKPLVKSRLNKNVRDCGFSRFSDYLTAVARDADGAMLAHLIEKISTHHSYFFRESDHFDYLAEHVFPEFEKRLNADPETVFRIWSAGCANGEEPYTLAICLHRFFGERYRRNFLILATDIAESSLRQATYGEYAPEKINETPPELRRHYFNITEDAAVLKPSVKSYVHFRKLNLIDSRYPFSRRFDLIFCRNVMIYFDRETRNALINRFYDTIKDDGLLFVGHAETLERGVSRFQYIRPSIYRKAGTDGLPRRSIHSRGKSEVLVHN